MKIEKWIVIPDMQVPYEDKRSVKAVEQYMADHRFDGYINLGDFLDLPMLSKYTGTLAGLLQGEDVEADFRAGRRILERHARILRKNNPDVRMILLEGNHEYRVVRFCDAQPQLRTILDVERNLRLKELGIKWVTCYQTGAIFKKGYAYFHHGRFVNKYHAQKHVDYYGTCIFYGHTHDIQSYTKVLKGADKSLVGHSLGCLCNYDQAYIRGHPTNWQQAFAVFYFFPDGYFTYNVVRIFKHRFVSPEGKIYKA